MQKIRLLDSDELIHKMGYNSHYRFEENYMFQKQYEELMKVFRTVSKQINIAIDFYYFKNLSN